MYKLFVLGSWIINKFILTALVILIFSALEMIVPNESEASCRCACVNGVKQNLCTSTLDIPVPCIGICPLAPPKIKPLKPLKLKPLGTTSCTMKQVYNTYTRRYEWKRVCR